MNDATPPYICKACGQPSWYHPRNQRLPPDYCHESDHGTPIIVENVLPSAYFNTARVILTSCGHRSVRPVGMIPKIGAIFNCPFCIDEG